MSVSILNKLKMILKNKAFELVCPADLSSWSIHLVRPAGPSSWSVQLVRPAGMSKISQCFKVEMLQSCKHIPSHHLNGQLDYCHTRLHLGFLAELRI